LEHAYEFRFATPAQVDLLAIDHGPVGVSVSLQVSLPADRPKLVRLGGIVAASVASRHRGSPFDLE
jgi:hypothetical protein